MTPLGCRAILTLLLVLATAPARGDELQGTSATLSWRITDIRQAPTTVDGAPHARHEFVLIVKNVTARPVVLRSYLATMSYAGIVSFESNLPQDVRIPPGTEYKFLIYALLPCPDSATPCRFRIGPAWRIVLSGRDGAGADFTTSIDAALPVEAGQPVVVTPKLTVTRASTAGAEAGRVNARFPSNVIVVPASVGGEELWLLLDTGAQLSMLRPDAARRLGLSPSADGPLFPASGFGGRVNAALVEWPPLRVGDYVIEHLIGGVTALPEFPVPIDGVLGANFIEAFRVTIDHKARELRLEPTR